jgi:hypothetical protein
MENTDDDKKNHAFLNDNRKWKLSSRAYDLQPEFQGIGYQQVIGGAQAHEPSIENALLHAGSLLTSAEANAEVAQMLAVLSRWPEPFRHAGVSERDIDALQRFVLIDRQLEAVSRAEQCASFLRP